MKTRNALAAAFQLASGRWRPATGHRGQPLQPGIAALVPCLDEEYTIKLCLESLAHFVQQIVCIDNGSGDRTLARMHEFKREHSEVEVAILEAPGALLAEARNLGLAMVTREWLLNTGGDCVFYTSGPLDARGVFGQLTRTRFQVAHRLGCVTLYGDLHHTTKLYDVYSLGEYYLVSFGPDVHFTERGRFDYLNFPRHYLRRTLDRALWFHLGGLKADERLIRRNCYFDWREAIGRLGASAPAWETFQSRWKEELFGSRDPRAVKFRFQRQLAVAHYERYDPSRYGNYPALVKREMAAGPGRFRVVYQDGRPYSRIDREDPEMTGYEPTRDDLAWDVEAFLRRMLTTDQRARIRI